MFAAPTVAHIASVDVGVIHRQIWAEGGTELVTSGDWVEIGLILAFEDHNASCTTCMWKHIHVCCNQLWQRPCVDEYPGAMLFVLVIPYHGDVAMGSELYTCML